MHRVAAETKAQLWERAAPELIHAVGIFVHNGAKVKGMKAKDALVHVLTEIVKLTYESGLDRGYDMGAHVFGDGSETDE